MLRIVLIRTGSTDFDQQRRIQGSLDIPLNDAGLSQARQTAAELSRLDITVVYCSPEQSARQTADVIAAEHNVKVKPVDMLKNLDHGLWHGKLIDEVREKQPKVYRQWQEHPETVCPPDGETLVEARERVRRGLLKLLRKHKERAVALVVSEPLTTLVRSCLNDEEVGDLWRGALNCGAWELIAVGPERAACI